MMTVLLIMIGLCFLMELVLVEINIFAIGACIIILALIILGFLKKRAKWMTAVGMVLIAVCMIGATNQERESYIFDYAKELKNIQELIDESETKEALDLLLALEEKYGVTEETILQKTQCYYVDSDFENAVTEMNKYPHKKSKTYFK